MFEALLIIGAIVLLFAFLLFSRKDMSKRGLRMGSLLKTTEDNEKITLDARAQEASEQQKRLLGNERYKILESHLQAEVKRIEAYSVEEAKKNIPRGQSDRVIEDKEFKIVIRLYTDFPAVKVTVSPKKFLGFLGAAEQWVYLK